MPKVKAIRDVRIRHQGEKKDFVEWDIIEVSELDINWFLSNGFVKFETTEVRSDEEVEEVKKAQAVKAKASTKK